MVTNNDKPPELSTADEIAADLASSDGVPQYAIRLFDEANVVFAEAAANNTLCLGTATRVEAGEMLQVADEIIRQI